MSAEENLTFNTKRLFLGVIFLGVLSFMGYQYLLPWMDPKSIYFRPTFLNLKPVESFYKQQDPQVEDERTVKKIIKTLKVNNEKEKKIKAEIGKKNIKEAKLKQERGEIIKPEEINKVKAQENKNKVDEKLKKVEYEKLRKAETAKLQKAEDEKLRKAEEEKLRNREETNREVEISENVSETIPVSSVEKRWQIIFENNPDDRYIWKSDPDCKNFAVRYAQKGTFRPTALASYPGSGNSWTMYLLSASTGVHAATIYPPAPKAENGETRTPDHGSVIIYRTHHGTQRSTFIKPDNQGWEIERTQKTFGYRGILLIRNPYDALRSYWNFKITRDHHASSELPTTFDPDAWSRFVLKGAENWYILINLWLQNSSDYIIVLYEDLKRDPRKEVIRMMNFLEVPVDEERLDCVMAHVEGPHNRKSSNDDLIKFVCDTPKLDQAVQTKISKANQLLKSKAINITLPYVCTKK